MSQVADGIFIIVILIVMVLDFFVFLKYRTFKSLPSLLISTSMALDLLVRLVELLIRFLSNDVKVTLRQ